jgi:hypothetical protein
VWLYELCAVKVRYNIARCLWSIAIIQCRSCFDNCRYARHGASMSYAYYNCITVSLNSICFLQVSYRYFTEFVHSSQQNNVLFIYLFFCFIMASVYTIRLWDKYTTRFPHDMFRPDGAIFRYIGVYTISSFLLLLSPHWPAFTHWKYVVCMVFVCPFLWNVLFMGYLKY